MSYDCPLCQNKLTLWPNGVEYSCGHVNGEWFRQIENSEKNVIRKTMKIYHKIFYLINITESCSVFYKFKDSFLSMPPIFKINRPLSFNSRQEIIDYLDRIDKLQPFT